MTTKKTVKKAPKKALPKIKLKEGKYSHKFLTRLDPQSGKQLEDLMKHFNQKTFNGTVVRLINRYQQLFDENEQRKKTISAINRDSSVLESRIQNFQESFNRLMRPVTDEQTLPDIDNICEDCLEPLSECTC